MREPAIIVNGFTLNGTCPMRFPLTAEELSRVPTLNNAVADCEQGSGRVSVPELTIPPQFDCHVIALYCSGRPPELYEETYKVLDYCGVDLVEAFSKSAYIQCAAEFALRNGSLCKGRCISGHGVHCDFRPYVDETRNLIPTADDEEHQVSLVWPTDANVSEALTANMLCWSYPIVTRKTENNCIDLRDRELTTYGKILLQVQLKFAREWFSAKDAGFKTDLPCNDHTWAAWNKT